jgi:hypothetical protein
VGCNCGSKNRIQYEVVKDGTRVFGPTPYKTTADAMAVRHQGEVREVAKGGA